MAPKKKAAKGKGGDDDGPDQGEMTGILQAHVDSLKQKLVLQQERQNGSQAKQEKIQLSELDMGKDMEAHRIKTQEMVKSMTALYREMERGLLKTITEQQQEVENKEQMKRDLNQQINQLNIQKEEMIMEKETEIRKLKEQLDEVSSDFANLLKNQLNKFQQRVVQGHQSFEQNQESNADGDRE